MQAFKVILLVACLAGLASASPQSSETCEKCKAGMAEMKENIAHTEQVVVSSCKNSPIKAMEDKCIAKAKEFIDRLSKETPEQICQFFNSCPREEAPSDLGQREELKCALCESCKQVAQMAKSGAMEARFQLKALCKSCGAPENVQKCKQTIDDFINNVEQRSPEELCAAIGICKKN